MDKFLIQGVRGLARWVQYSGVNAMSHMQVESHIERSCVMINHVKYSRHWTSMASHIVKC